MCPSCKKCRESKLFSHPIPFTLMVSAGLLVWLSALFSVGALLLR
ncbi:hypothetical protein [Pseudoflavonifractor sp. 60]|nr:hypothetical protein [Pseudoflavonifractor sp. 60]